MTLAPYQLWKLVPVWSMLILAWLVGTDVWSDPHNRLLMLTAFVALFVVILFAAFRVVHHAEELAERLGEPIGTMVLTLSIVIIEVSIIAAVMISGDEQPTLARDTMFAILMLVLNGLVGFSLLFGGLRHGEMSYNLQSATTYLAVILPLSVIALILPSYTQATDDPTFSVGQSVLIAVATFSLYLVLLGVQTTRHRSYFDHREVAGDIDPGNDDPLQKVAEPKHVIWMHALLLFVYLAPVVILAKMLAIPIEHGITELRLPVALGGLLVAVLILSPEALGAIVAARKNLLQKSINILLGAATATIGLTVTAVLGISVIFNEPLILGLDPEHSLLLVLTLAVSMITFNSGRTNMLLGAVHLVLFLTYLMLLFDDF